MNITPRKPQPIELSPEDWDTIYLALVDAWNSGFGFMVKAKGKRLKALARKRIEPYGAMIDRLFPDNK